MARPKVTLQLAHSNDGYIARPGARTKLSCEQTWQRVYDIRAKMDAVMIGIQTALTDNPTLKFSKRRIIVDTNARLPETSTLAQTARDAPVWLLTSKPASHLEALGVRVIQCPTIDEHIDLKSALAQLDLTHILCEGGAQLAQSLNNLRLIDHLTLIESDIGLGNGVPLPFLTHFTPISEETVGTDTWRNFDARRASIS